MYRCERATLRSELARVFMRYPRYRTASTRALRELVGFVERGHYAPALHWMACMLATTLLETIKVSRGVQSSTPAHGPARCRRARSARLRGVRPVWWPT